MESNQSLYQLYQDYDFANDAGLKYSSVMNS